MNIIYYVDFKSSQINNDFKISNALISKHTILLVNSLIQLQDSLSAYDIVIQGLSALETNLNINKPLLKLDNLWDLDRINMEIEKSTNHND